MQTKPPWGDFNTAAQYVWGNCYIPGGFSSLYDAGGLNVSEGLTVMQTKCWKMLHLLQKKEELSPVYLH